MSKALTSRACLVLCCVCGLSAVLAMGRAKAPPAPVIAVIDLEKALAGLKEKEHREKEWTSKGEELQKKVQDLGKQVEAQREKIKVLPDGPEKKAQTEQLGRMIFQLEFESQYSQRIFSRMEGDVLRELYQKIDEASATLAKRNGYTMVLASDENVIVPEGEGREVTRTIALKRMLFVDPAHDITDELITLMNNEFGAGSGK